MPASANGGRNGGSRSNYKKDDKLMDTLRAACPPHRIKDLDSLMKTLNGDEAKIREKIQEWWEEPEQGRDEQWEDVNKKSSKKKHQSNSGRGGRSDGRGRGRGFGRSGGRGGGGRDRGGRSGERGRGGPSKQQEKEPEEATAGKSNGESAQAAPPQPPAGVPPTETNAPTLKGAWGARVAAPAPVQAPAAPFVANSQPVTPPQPKPEDTSALPEANPLDVVVITQNDPTPAGRNSRIDPKPIPRAAPPSSNVWATKGSAHLIQAEKPQLSATVPPSAHAPVAPVAPIAPKLSVQQPKSVEPEAIASEPVPDTEPSPLLESGLPSSWGAQPEPNPEPAPLEMPPPPSPSVPKPPLEITSVQVIEEKNVPISPKPVPAPQPPPPTAPVNVLNMGRWETNDENLDFGFGSFGADDTLNSTSNNAASSSASIATSKEQMPAPSTQPSSAVPTSSVSPARPPPGLSIGAMPPMPPNAVLVHELESNLESASLSQKKDQSVPVHMKPMQGGVPVQPEMPPAPAPVLPSASLTQQNYGQYGMPGMYNYSAGNGFVGVHTPAGPVLASGVIPPQPGKPQPAALGPGLPQQALYGTQPPQAPSSGNAMPGADNLNENATAASGIPPGMHGTMPAYANPALYYGQHQFQMGHHQGGIGYNYGYGAQFGGVAQGGIGYQQFMSQGGAYGAPHYEEQPPHQGNTSVGYQQKAGGGYRGRNSHHNNNQYQNQYNPQQHGGYGGQPYNMGYHGDHFNQRVGYPGGMGDPYGMQQGGGNYQSVGMGGSFQDDDHHKGKKGNRGNGPHNSGLQQFQPPPPHQLGGTQQPFGLQGQSNDNNQSNAGGGGGGWSNQSGGWSGGAPSWQGS